MTRRKFGPMPMLSRVGLTKRGFFAAALAMAVVAGCATPEKAARAPFAKLHRPIGTAVASSAEKVGQDFSWQEAFSKAQPTSRPVGFRVDETGSPEVGVAPEASGLRASGGQAAGNQSADPLVVEAELNETLDSDLSAAESLPIVPPQADDASLEKRLPETDRLLSVDQCVGMALANHPAVMAARQRVSAELHRIPQAKALPNPVFNNTFWPIQDQSLQTAAGRVANQMSVSQSVPWPEKLRTKAAIVSREVQIAAADVERIEREVTESVRLAYYEIWFSSRAIEIVDETRELVSDLTKVAEAKYRSGGTQQDVLRARLESDRLENQRIGLQGQKQAAQADLAALLQQPVTLDVETQVDLGLTDVPARLDELVTAAERCNPELAGLAWEVQRDRQKQRLACLERYPDLQFGLNWGLVSDGRRVVSPVANGADLISFNVGTTLPIWKKKIDGGIRETANRTSSSAKLLEAKRDALYGKLRRLLSQANALSEQRNVYRDRIIPRTEDTLKLSIADYRGKRTDFFTLIETFRELLMFETQVARIEASLAGTIAQIDRATGCP